MSNYSDVVKKLHDKAKEFGVYLNEVNSLNNEVMGRAEKLLKAIEKISETKSLATKITCNVCFTRERTHAIVPCGHGGLCQDCATRAQQRNRCFTCRGRIEDILRIYL